MVLPTKSDVIGWLPSSSQSSAAVPSSTISNDLASQAIPAVVDRYRLLRPLGWGGTGIVCEAYDTALRRRVAIKLIPNNPNDGDAPPQIPREAQFAGAVQHQQVVLPFAAGTYPDGVYLVMELVEGQSIQALLDAGRLPWREATVILVSACEALMAVHACGIVHHDIKPANLLRTSNGSVTLMDFGLARWLDPAKRPEEKMGLAGTPHYMSPEQCWEEECDERTDIYSLGATYYTLLTGETPYPNGGFLRILVQHCSGPVPDPRNVQGEIPPACAEIVMRAMAKKQSDRYDSAREIQHALRAVLLGGPNGWQI